MLGVPGRHQQGLLLAQRVRAQCGELFAAGRVIGNQKPQAPAAHPIRTQGRAMLVHEAQQGPRPGVDAQAVDLFPQRNARRWPTAQGAGKTNTGLARAGDGFREGGLGQ